MAKRNKQFDESLTDMIFAHLDKVKDLKNQMADENSDFDKRMKEQVQTFNEAMLDMEQAHQERINDYKKDLADETSDHDKKVSDIQAQIDREESYGKNARQSRLTDLKQQLADEMASYSDKVAETQSKIDEENASYDAQVQKRKDQNAQETADMMEEHQKQLNDIQTQLTAEQDILNAHQTQVDAVKDKAREDDIARLIRQHNEENAEADKQHQKRMTDIVQQGAAEGAAGGAAFSGPMNQAMDTLKKSMDDKTKDMAATMVNNVVEGAKKAGSDMVKNFFNALVDMAKQAIKFAINVPLLKDLFSIAQLPKLASGATNFPGGMALVGEQGPELVNLPRGAEVYTAGQTKDMLAGGQNIIINIAKVDSKMDVEQMAREIGYRIGISS